MSELEVLVGQTLVKITGAEAGSEDVFFENSRGDRYKMWHNQECCESVWLEEVIGDVDDLIGAPIARAECVTSAPPADEEYLESATWTFYKFATIKGEVVLRWVGESNGYYSESVDFDLCHAGDALRMEYALLGKELPRTVR